MDVKMYRSRKEQWCGSAGGRGEGEDELYTVMDFYIRTPQRVTWLRRADIKICEESGSPVQAQEVRPMGLPPAFGIYGVFYL